MRFRQMLAAGLMLAMLAGCGGGQESSSQGGAQTGGAAAGGTTAGGYIGEAAAKAAALGHAGVAEGDTYQMKVELDRDDGVYLYEVEFKAGGMEYEYEIDAYSGAVLKAERDYDD